MNFKGLDEIRIDGIDDWVTNVNVRQLRENCALELRGNRISKNGMMFQGDFGTQHRFYSYPLRPNAVKLITGTNNSAGKVRIECAAHGYSNGQLVYISNVNGTTEANGVWVVGNAIGDPDEFTLTGSTYANAYVSGGYVTSSPITIVDGSTVIDSSTGYEHEIIVGVDSAGDTRIFIDTSSAQTGTWIELTETMTGTVNDASIGANDTSVIISSTMTENGNSLDITDSVRFPADYFKGWIAYNVQQDNYAYVSAFTAGATPTLTFGATIIGSNGLGWATTNTIALYRNSEAFLAGFTGSTGFYTYANSATPHVRINSKGSKRKATVYYGNPSTKSYGKPMQAIRRTANTSVLGSNWSLYSGWYLRNAQMPQTCNLIGSTGVPINPGTAAGEDYFYDGIAVVYTPSSTFYVTGNTPFVRFAITMQIGEQESDPILMIYNASTDGAYNDYWCNLALQFFIDPAKIPKGMTGLNIYAWIKEWEVANVAVTANGAYTADDFDQYMYLGTVDINTGWSSGGYTLVKQTVDSVASYWAKTTSISFTYAALLALNFGNGAGSLLSRLGHVPDLNRSYMTPRYVANTKENRGGFVVVDEDDNTIRRSAFNGFAVSMDDSFVDLTVDDQDQKQQWDLSATGELLGIAIVDDTIICLKRYEIEFIDPQSGIQRKVQADVLSKESITQTPYGISWMGNNGIYFLENGSYQPILINENFLNRYDGTEFCTGTTSYITDAYRTAGVGGYNPFYDELVFFIKTNNTSEKKYVYRYSFQKKRWMVREFQLGVDTSNNVDIKYFWKRNDGTMTIGCAGGLFKYPVSTLFTDGSRINQSGATIGGNGFERFLKFNFGSLYDLLKNNIFKIFMLDKQMESSSGTAAYNIKFFANFESSAFDTKTAPMDSASLPRPLEPRGAVDTMQVEISNTGVESTTKQFDILSFFAGIQRFTRIGNR